MVTVVRTRAVIEVPLAYNRVGVQLHTNAISELPRLTLVASALAGGPPVADIDDADVLRTGGTARWSRRRPRWVPSLTRMPKHAGFRLQLIKESPEWTTSGRERASIPFE